MRLELKYEPLDKMYDLRYDKNPKEHDLGLLYRLIKKHGFRVPTIWDNTLNAVIAGAGRIEALWLMYLDWCKDILQEAPQGIELDDKRMWLIPVIYGIDAKDMPSAIAFLLDDNNAPLTGGTFTALDMSRMWDETQYLELLTIAIAQTETVDQDDYNLMLQLLGSDPQIQTDDEQPNSDKSDADNYFWLRIPFVDKLLQQEATTLLNTIPIEERGEYILGLLNGNN